MSYCTAINCIDGRIQIPVIRYLQERLNVLYVDVVSETGPVCILSDPSDSESRRSIVRRVRTSFEAHASTAIAVVAHTDCAGNPATDEHQRRELALSADSIAATFPETPVLGLWVNDRWSVEEICNCGPAVRADQPDA